MPTFSSAQVTDPFLSTGELLAPMAAFDTHQNQLYKQQSDQQQIGLTDMATVARAAAPLLGMSEQQTRRRHTLVSSRIFSARASRSRRRPSIPVMP